MDKDSIIEQLWLGDKKQFTGFIYKLRDRLATEAFRNFFTKEVIEDLLADSLNILIIKYLNTGRVTELIHAKKTLYNIIRIEFKVVLGRKTEEFYYSLGKQKYASYLFDKRVRAKVKYERWQVANYTRYLELARNSYHRNKNKLTPERIAKKRAYFKAWQQNNKAKKKIYNRKYREKTEALIKEVIHSIG